MRVVQAWIVAGLIGPLAFADSSGLAANRSLSIPLDSAAKVRMDFVWIKPGTFQMGEGPDAERVRIARGFWMQTTEVTQAQWQALMDSNPSMFPGPDHPVEQVSWESARAFTEKLTARLHRLRAGLPTEAEWEYACRAGSTGAWCFGDDGSKLGDYAWFGLGSEGNHSFPVARKKPNAWGLYDMHGNVLEWCEDAYEPRSGDPVPDRNPKEGVRRAIRGGGWYGVADLTRSFSRWSYPQDMVGCMNGLRVALR